MSISLYDATVPSYLQFLAGARRILQRGLDDAQAKGWDPDAFIETRLIEDMFPFSFQIRQIAKTSAGALKEASAGAFAAPGAPPANQTYADLQAVIAEADEAVKGWTPEAVNALQGREVVLGAGEFKQTFVAENYLLSFAMPNFYFHLTTAYDMLRAKGVPLGKAQYLGKMRFK